MIKIRLALKDSTEKLILTSTNLFYFLKSLFNLVNLRLINDAGNYHYNQDQTLYNLQSQKTLAFAKRYKISFFLNFFNLSAEAVNLFKDNEIVKGST